MTYYNNFGRSKCGFGLLSSCPTILKSSGRGECFVIAKQFNTVGCVIKGNNFVKGVLLQQVLFCASSFMESTGFHNVALSTPIFTCWGHSQIANVALSVMQLCRILYFIACSLLHRFM